MVLYDKIVYDSAPIGSVSVLAKILDSSQSHLESIAKDVDRFYITFEKKIGSKTRLLCDPKDELKRIQKKIISRIFCHLVFPSYLQGGIKAEDSRDFFSNATLHAGAHIAIAIDVKDFFPSITQELVEQTFKRLFKFPQDVAAILARLTTRQGAVPQGAPTSTYVSNFVMFEKEYRLAAALRSQGFCYSRLIDDITVSSRTPLSKLDIGKVTSNVIRMLSAYGFKQREDKYKIYTRSNPKELMTITGLWLNRGSPRVSTAKRDDISARVVRLAKLGVVASERETIEYHQEFNALSGKVALLQRVGHREASRLRAILREIRPIYSAYEVAKYKKLISAFCRRASDRSKLGYIRKFYKFQYCVGIIRNNDPKLAATLRRQLSHVRPTKKLSDFDES